MFFASRYWPHLAFLAFTHIFSIKFYSNDPAGYLLDLAPKDLEKVIYIRRVHDP